MELAFIPKLLLQHDASPDDVLTDVAGAFLAAARERGVLASLSPSGDALAVALGQRLVLVRGLGAGTHYGAAANVEFVSALDAPEAATALAWLAAGGASTDECVLLGTSEGQLQLHSAASGALLLRQRLHHSALLGAAVRWAGTGSDPEDLSEDVTLAFADAVVRLPAWEVWAAVRWATGRAERGGGHWWGGGAGGDSGAAPHQLGFSKFTLPKSSGPRTAALCLGPPPPSLYAELAGRAAMPHRVRILTAGAGPPLAAFEAEEASTPGLLSLVSDLASSTAASLLGRAAAYVPRPGRSLLGGLRRGGSAAAAGSTGSMASASASASSSAADLASLGQAGGAGHAGGRRRGDKIPGEPASLAAAVWDEKRCVTQMALSPCGRLAACCDTLGRVLLVEPCSTLIVRMLKGYRDAQVAWLVCGPPSGGGGTAAGAAAAAVTGGGGWAAHFGSTSSLGSLDRSAPVSLQGSAADLAALAQDRSPGTGGHATPASASSPEQRAAGGGTSSPAPGVAPAAAAAADEQAEQRRHHRGTLLVTHAPRRGLVELWEPHSLTRLGSLHCGSQPALLLQQPARRAGGGAGGRSGDRSGGSASGGPTPNRVLLLDAASLQLTDLTAALNQLAAM